MSSQSNILIKKDEGQTQLSKREEEESEDARYLL